MEKQVEAKTRRGAFVALSAAAIALAAGGISTTANAAKDKRWYFMPTVTYTFVDGDRVNDSGVDDALGARLTMGKPLSYRTSFETSIFYKALPRNPGVQDKDMKGISADLVRFFGGGDLRPLVLAGVGFTHSDILAQDDETDYHLEVGLGVDWKMTNHGTSMRLEGRHMTIEDDESVPGQDHFNDWEVGLGLSVPLGAPPAPEVAVTSRDADKDGVLDDRDRCPYSRLGATVDASGCERVKPKDDDKDGVRNELDTCPGTAMGVKVDARGCGIPQVLSLEGVKFKTNSSDLRSESVTILNNAAMTLKSMPDARVEVAGHTDSRGDASYNKWLSQRRADQVRKYLIGKGVDGSKLTARGYGETQPVADNNVASGRLKNRRVELRVTR